jgi:uncharacterized protein (DUF302 family)
MVYAVAPNAKKDYHEPLLILNPLRRTPMRTYIFILMSLLLPLSAVADSGMVHTESAYTVEETGNRLINVLEKKGMTIFTRINHSDGAKKVDKVLRPTEVIIFGNPKVGTPLMQCAQTVAIDLPQKALIWEDEKGTTYLSYNDPAYLVSRHHIKGCDNVIKKISGALANFAKAATTNIEK